MNNNYAPAIETQIREIDLMVVSQAMPGYALNLNPDSVHFGWIMRKTAMRGVVVNCVNHPYYWTPHRRISREEVVRGMSIERLQPYAKQLELLLDRMQLLGKPWDEFHRVCEARMRHLIRGVTSKHERQWNMERNMLNLPEFTERGR